MGWLYQPSPEFLSGLLLWLAWEEELVQAGYRREIVTWLYDNGADGSVARPIPYRELCELFSAWELVTPAVPMTFYCAEEPSSFAHIPWPPTNLRRLPLSFWPDEEPYNSSRDPLTGALYAGRLGQPIAVATLLEYTTHTYGQASVVALLQAAVEGESWRSVPPLLFGVSVEEFEAGWRGWLAAEYGVDISEFVAAGNPSLPDLVLDPVAARQALTGYQARLR